MDSIVSARIDTMLSAALLFAGWQVFLSDEEKKGRYGGRMDGMLFETEDQVRNGAAVRLGFDDGESDVQQGTGQITSFNQLGFRGVADKPDGWHLPDVKSRPAIILETKAGDVDISEGQVARRVVQERCHRPEEVRQGHRHFVERPGYPGV